MHARPNDLYLSYRHEVVLGPTNGRSDALNDRPRLSPYKARLEKELDTANQIDLQEKANGATIDRLP